MELLTDLYVSELIGKPVMDRGGRRLGKVRDIVVERESLFPSVRGLVVGKKGDFKEIPWPDIYLLSRKFVALQVAEPDVHYAPVKEDAYRTSMILDQQIVDINGAKVVRVNDIKLAGDGNDAHIVSVDVGVAGLIRRFLAGRLGGEQSGKWVRPQLIRWDVLQPLPKQGEHLALKVSADKLAKMHPVDLADIVENLSHHERRELFEQLDPEVAADTLAEVEMDVQVSILKGLDKERAADILEEMEQDEAVDLLSELTDEDSDQLLNLMDHEEASDLRGLLEYEEGTAGSMMTTDFLAFAEELTCDAVIERLRELAPDADYVYYLYVIDGRGRLSGVVSLRELIVSPPERKIGEIMRRRVISVTAEEEEKQIRRLFTKYSLLALPVVDDAGKLIGIITVDDVLSLPINSRGLKM
ncbi:CBS domain protein [Acididesulfobacillus acetoxydans]|uniref:CBS domain protein n=1 Tax=Acididesulfobacillus acetoxydans TaxID=1561005 RepID=A0A8S0WND8_9FIRM|nr:CBS domain-containing protein [Acididesulfobacillus acetoxydans]CAA7601254.1 CBS domain protein [Acididesulfobacillus acetoxydans]CEJ08467.1 Magnesium transporter MgtE [Acididesulfobacillus acetoxydans]